MRLVAGEWLRKEPKTPAAIRSIRIAPLTTGVLAENVERFSGSGPDGLVFANKVGGPLISSSFWGNHFTPAQRQVGLVCRFHDLRHSSVALAIAEGAHPKAIRVHTGHSSINVTLDRYGQLFPELDEAQVDVVPLSDGQVGIRADAQVIWYPTRSPAETIPPEERSVAVEVSGGTIIDSRPRLSRCDISQMPLCFRGSPRRLTICLCRFPGRGVAPRSLHRHLASPLSSAVVQACRPFKS